MFLGFRAIDDYLRFCFQVVNTSGAEAVASSLTCAVFEESTNSPILSASVSAVDSVNYKGLYRVDVQLLTAYGFEEGKQYHFRAKCDIDGITTASLVGYLIIDSMRAKVDSLSAAALLTIQGSVLSAPPSGFGVTSIAGYLDKVKHAICNRSLIDENTNTLTHYKDDGVTPSIVFDLKDEVGVPTVDEPFERIPQ